MADPPDLPDPPDLRDLAAPAELPASAGLPSPAELDAADPLRAFQDRFRPLPPGLINLDGNSLGQLPADTPVRIAHLLEREWGERLIRAWEERWTELPLQVGDRLGEHLLGAAPRTTVIADSTTVCFYKLAAAALQVRPDRPEIITDSSNFPTDRYVLEGLAAAHGRRITWIEPDPQAGPTPDQVADVISDRTALVTLSHVDYRSAHIADLERITATAHDAGALVLWDLSHSAGALPVGLDDHHVDLAVGCTYKYLNGGPGAPAFLYVREALQAGLRQPIWGWWGRRDRFGMAAGYDAAPGLTGMLSGTPPVLGLTASAAGIDLSIEAGIDAIRAKSTRLTEYAIALTDARLASHGVDVGSPRDPDRRGSHVALVHPRARDLARQLIDREVLVDFREPDVIRLGLSPLTTSFTHVHDALERLHDILTGTHGPSSTIAPAP
ncbi:MAG: kynureninase [Solirubrobacterales bacterium]|nr:kynureninase [Solirubrobacterales bacterium]